MARVLDALNHAEHGLARPAVPLPRPPPPVRPERATEPETEVPFIEIGGPGTPPLASALVRASGPLPQPRAQSDAPLASTPQLGTEVCAADPVESLPIGVQFQ